MTDGYLLLHRKIVEWEWYQDINTKVLFLHLLLKANWKDGRFFGREIPKGSLVTSIGKLASETNLTPDEVRTSLKHLIQTGEITKQSTNKYSVITISEWDLYQATSQANTNQDPTKSQTIPKPFPTIEERNKERRKEDTIVSKDTIRPSIDRKDAELIVSEWNSLSDTGIKPLMKLSPQTKRYDNLGARIKQYSLDDVIKAIRKIRNSDFLMGKSSDFQITFDWFVKPNNFIKVLEGNYDNKEKPSGRDDAADWRKEWIKEHDSGGTG